MTDDRTGSDYVLDALAAEGIDRLFGLIGEGNADLLDSTHEHDVPFHYARHEQAAVSMADGYARTTGSVGVCTLTHGPGLTNGATGIAIADRDDVPLVVLVGDTDSEGRETSLQYLEHLDFTEPISVAGMRAETVGRLPEILRRAFDTARTRSGPVVVELPGDVQSAAAPTEPYRPRERSTQRVGPDPDLLDEAVGVLQSADSPVVLAGGGAAASGAADAVEPLAERLGAPIVATFYAVGLFDADHPLYAGIGGTFMTPAAAEFLPDADAVVALGARLSGKTTRYGALYDDADVVQVDVREERLGTHRDPAVGIVGDARATAAALAERLPGASKDRVERVRDRIAAAGDPPLGDDAAPGTVDPRNLTAAIADRLPGDEVVTVDSGNNTGFPPVYHPVDAGGRMLVNGNFGTMGYALPAALGASVADRERPVVCYIGDGAFMMMLQEVETAVRLELPILLVVYNDESYGIIRHRQGLKKGRTTAAEYDSPDFAAVARGLGADAVTVRSLADFEAVDADIAALDGPLVVDARTDPDVSRPGFPPY
jgi:acetolactate synthase-1/2/3 large subunit